MRFWEDKCLGSFTLQDRYPRLYSVSSQTLYTISDVGLWNGDTWISNLRWRRVLFDWENLLVDELHAMIQGTTPKLDKNDQLVWLSDLNGFSVKSFLASATPSIFEQNLESHIVEFIWQHQAPPRAELLV